MGEDILDAIIRLTNEFVAASNKVPSLLLIGHNELAILENRCREMTVVPCTARPYGLNEVMGLKVMQVCQDNHLSVAWRP
jgi:hypothetical protein